MDGGAFSIWSNDNTDTTPYGGGPGRTWLSGSSVKFDNGTISFRTAIYATSAEAENAGTGLNSGMFHHNGGTMHIFIDDWPITDNRGQVIVGLYKCIPEAADTTPPSISITQPAGPYSNSPRAQIKATISDSDSGINASSIRFSLNGTGYSLGNFSTHTLSFAGDTGILTFTPKFDYAALVSQTASIEANDNAGNMANASATFTTDSSSMLQISTLGAEVSGNGIFLAWDKPGFTGADLNFYKIYRATAQIPSEAAKYAFYYASTAGTSFTDLNVLKSRTYYYYATSVDLAGNESVLSNERSIAFDGLVRLSADKNSISMQEGTSYGIEFTILNDTTRTRHIILSADSDDSDLHAELLATEMTLNRNETSDFTLSIIADQGVNSGSHTITVTAFYDGIETSYDIAVTVGTGDFVEFNALNQTVCNEDYTVRLPVDITNLTGSSKTITLTADNSTFLPRWEDSTITLSANETETVDLLLNNSPSSENTGDYTVQVTAKSGSKTSVAELSFTMEDCENSGIMDFTLEIDSSSFSMSKGTVKRVGYRIRNNSDNEGYVNVSIETELDTDYNSVIFVRDNTTYYDYAVVKPGIFDEPKRYDFKIRAYNENFTRERTISINLLRTHYFEFSSAENEITLRKGQSRKIGLEFKNADFAESFTLRSDSNYSKLGIDFDEDSFSMNERTSKESFFTISADSDASTGIKSVRLKARTGSIAEKTIELKVRIVEGTPEPPSAQEIIVESYPLKTMILPGESKTISFTLYNSSESSVAFASIHVEGLPAGVSAESASESIGPLQRKTINVTLKAAKNAELGDFEVQAIIGAFGDEQEKDFPLRVGGEQQGFFSGLFTGFLSIGESVWLGVIALIVIIVLLVLLGKAAGPDKPKEDWQK